MIMILKGQSMAERSRLWGEVGDRTHLLKVKGGVLHGKEQFVGIKKVPTHVFSCLLAYAIRYVM